VKNNKEQDFKKFLDGLLEKNNSHKALPKIPKDVFEKISNEQWLIFILMPTAAATWNKWQLPT